MPQPSASKRSLGARLSAKAGPLPVWAWAALLLGVVFLYTRLHPSSSTTPAPPSPTDSASSADSTPAGPDASGNPPASGGGGPAGNVNDQLLSQLSGFQGSIDSLTAAVQSSQAFTDPGTSGSLNWGGVDSTAPPAQVAPAPKKKRARTAAPKAKPKPARGPIRYYTYRKNVPLGAGQKVRFTAGKGYYAA